jgi:UDP-GlcNAc:undecaprenyl-phosphate GlcNAc-1-phosphate transferase
MIYAILIFVLSFLLTMLSLPQILLVSYQKKLFDKPEARKQHRTPSSRLGGFCFVPVLFFSVSLLGAVIIKLEPDTYLRTYTDSLSCMTFFAAGLILVYMMGLMDDLIGLGYKRKFVVQILGALMLWLAGVGINSLGGLFGITDVPYWMSLPLTLLFVVYITNSVNLIDGIDGLASGLGILALALFVVFSSVQMFHLLNLLLFSSMLGILLPFWYYNVYRRRRRNFKLFMGDGGSLSLGYVLAYGLLIYMHRYSQFDPWSSGQALIGLAAFVVPCFDIVRVMLVRARAGKSMFLPDRNHVHHKMMRAGFTPLRSMYLLVLLSLGFILLNTLLVRFLAPTWVLLADIFAWCLFHWLLNRRIRRREA